MKRQTSNNERSLRNKLNSFNPALSSCPICNKPFKKCEHEENEAKNYLRDQIFEQRLNKVKKKDSK